MSYDNHKAMYENAAPVRPEPLFFGPPGSKPATTPIRTGRQRFVYGRCVGCGHAQVIEFLSQRCEPCREAPVLVNREEIP